MPSPARCSRRGRSPWTGRGMHAVAVMANIQQAQRCDCADRSAGRAAGPGPRRVVRL